MNTYWNADEANVDKEKEEDDENEKLMRILDEARKEMQPEKEEDI